MGLGKLSIAAASAAIFLAYCAYKIVYNLYFHPLAKFPGPWWAAVSYLAELYYDIVQGGQYYKKVNQMHEKYGSLVRVNPHELSLNDPIFYEKVYAGGGQKRHKDPSQASSTGFFTATIGTVDHDLHRKRRAYLANFFSKKAITDLEPVVQSKVETLAQKLKDAHHSGEKLDGVIMFGALAADVVKHYSYGESFEELNKPGFGQLEHGVKGILLTFHLRRFFPAIDVVLNRLPMWIMERMNPSVVTYLEFDDTMTQYSNDALRNSKEAIASGKAKTLFDALVHPSIPAQERTLQRLKDESALILFAGLDTTARFLTAAAVYLITYPAVLGKLREELRPLADGQEFKPTWNQLEALPYLTAAILESLRYQCCFTGRFPRQPMEPLLYKDLVIPAGTTVGASPYSLNNHPSVFPNPHIFRPERCLEAKPRGEYLDRYLVTFTKGSRGCLGINLGYAEMYLTIATVAMKFDLELVDSSIENITPYRDFNQAFDKEYNFGVNFKVKRILME